MMLTSDMVAKVRAQFKATLASFAHIPPAGATVIIAVSGGVDSMVLWEVLAADARWKLIIYHLNHGLRSEASADLALIHAFALKSNEVEIVAEQVDIAALARAWRCSLETAGRRQRYQRLRSLAVEHGVTMVMTAHHLNDQAETVLANLLRGAGPMGRAGIPPQRRLAPGIYLARPLLQVPRVDIVAYAQKMGIPWLEDHTNRDETYNRNRLRHSVLPTLEYGVPGITSALASLAQSAQAKVEEYETAVAEVWDKLSVDAIEISAVVAWPIDQRLHLWRKLAEWLGISIQRNWLRRIDELAMGPVGQRVHAEKWMLLKRRERLTWALATPTPVQLSTRVEGTGTFIRGKEKLVITAALVTSATIPLLLQRTADHAVIDADQVTFPWIWRLAEMNERFVPLGAPGTQTVIKHLANRDVASQHRAITPVLADAFGIIWIPGFTIAHRARVQTTTVRVWEIHRSLG
jgi:tRNA(Ile)-lysidine synthase